MTDAPSPPVSRVEMMDAVQERVFYTRAALARNRRWGNRAAMERRVAVWEAIERLLREGVETP